jgi:hypothetical protein
LAREKNIKYKDFACFYECRSKLFEEGYWRDFLKLVRVFKEASKNLPFDFLCNKNKTKIKNQRIYILI